MDFFRMNPFSLMRRMTEEMDRIFSDGGQERQSDGDMLWAPAAEVSQHEGNYIILVSQRGVHGFDK
jgi:HSP20 family molecular chaperone IbpA